MSRGIDAEVAVLGGDSKTWLGESLAATVRIERQVLTVRWLGIAAAAPAGLFLLRGREQMLLWLICALAAAYNLLFGSYLIPHRPGVLRRGYLTATGDALLTSAIILFTGGIRSEFFVIFYLVAIISAIRFGVAEAAYSVVVETVLYTATAFAVGIPRDLTVAATVAAIGLRMSFAAITAVFAGSFVDRVRAAETQVEASAVKARQQLSEATAALTRSLDLRTVMQEAARWTAELAGAAQVEIGVVPPANLAEWLSGDPPGGARRLTLKVRPEAAGTSFSLPLVYGSEDVGRLTITLEHAGEAFDPVRRHLVDIFASRCGPALANVWTHAAMQAQALADPTTGLANHRRFKEFLADCEQDAPRLRRPLSIIMLDLDMFKEFNDTYGHLAGDRALRQVGRILRDASDGHGLAARYGGDEFVAVLPGVGRNGASDIAHVVADAFKRSVEHRTEGLAPPTGVSIGWATAAAGDGDYQTLVGRADLAMYFAKRSGGGVKGFDEMDAVGPLPALAGSSATRTNRVDLRAMKTPRGTRGARTDRYGGPAPGLEVVRLLLVMMRAKDPRLYLHCRNVARLCFCVARRLGLSPWTVHDVGLAGLLHDVGKITVPDAILQKPAALTPEERARIRQHAAQGGAMLATVPGLVAVAVAVCHHHENFGGGGYPDGLAGEEIPLASRIVLVADAYDAITADRPYAKGRPPAAAVRILRESQGSQFDPRAVVALTTVLNELDARKRRRRPAARVGGV